MSGWIGVDLDGTLAEYHGWPKDGSIGKPIAPMLERVKQWLAEGREVRIMTARVWPLGTDEATKVEWVQPDEDSLGGPSLRTSRTPAAMQAILQLHQIETWCKEHVGQALKVTCSKDYGMIELWDDRAVQVIPNTGQRADGR